MGELFLNLARLSLTGALFALAVMAVRALFRKAPKWLFCLLWGLVALRLVCPVTLESRWSLVPEHLATGQAFRDAGSWYVGEVDIFYESNSGYSAALEAGRDPVYTEEGSYVVTEKGSYDAPVTVAETVFPTLGWIWLAGTMGMLLYTGGSYLALKRRLEEATHLRENIWQSEAAASPFVLGLFRPRIYLGYQISDADMEHVIAHERAHICRGDHWWKPLGFLILSVYWFNPVLWFAYILVCRDIEGACDEKVIRHMEKEQMQAYSTALLHCSIRRCRIAACPLAFGESGVKGRIRSIMNYKKPAFWVLVMAILASLAAGALFLTNPAAGSGTLMGAYYKPAELLYTNKQGPVQIYSQFCVTADYRLYARRGEETDWSIGQQMEQVSVTAGELKANTSYEKGWHRRYSIRQITDAYLLRTEEGHFFLVAQLKNGDTLLGYGWGDIEQVTSGSAGLEYLYRLESGHSRHVFAPDFFSLSLGNTVGETDCFAFYQNDKNPGFLVVGFMADPAPEAAYGYNDMGYAVFQENGNGYRLLDCHVYDNAANENGGILFCSDPAVLAPDGVLRNKVTFDVILSCNTELDQVRREYYRKDSLVLETVAGDLGGGRSMTLFRWGEKEGSNVSVKQYYLDREGNEIGIGELRHGSSKLVPGTVYVPYQCVYMNPLSSFAAIGGDSGYRYRIGESSFEMIPRSTEGFLVTGESVPGGHIISYPVDQWLWQEFPFTDREWAELFRPAGFGPMENISEYFEEMYCQPITEDLLLLKLDDALWLAKLTRDRRVGTYLWSIYSLVPENSLGSAQWEYVPVGSQAPLFRFTLDMEYTDVFVYCNSGRLVDLEGEGAPESTNMTYTGGTAFFWTPIEDDGSHAQSAKLSFSVKQGELPVCQGTVYIESEPSIEARRIYTARVVGTGLRMDPGTEKGGAVISWADGRIRSVAFKAELAGNTSLQNSMTLTAEQPWWSIAVMNRGAEAINVEIAGEVYEVSPETYLKISPEEPWEPGTYAVSLGTAGSSGMEGTVLCEVLSGGQE